MIYNIEDNITASLDIVEPQKTTADTVVCLPYKVNRNIVTISTPVVENIKPNSADVTVNFQCNADYLGGIDVGGTTYYSKNPSLISKTIVGLTPNTDYTVKGLAIAVYGELQEGENITFHTKANPIPQEYQLVEYIEGTGDQYLELLYSLNQDSKIYVKVKINVVGTNGAIFLSRQSYGSDAYGVWDVSSGSKIRFDYAKSVQVIGDYSDEIIEIKTDANKFEIVDKVSYEFTKTTFTTPEKVTIFKGASTCTKMTLYLFEIIGVCKLYPVYRKSDNKAGMYDTENNVFYINKGTGDFIVGPDKEWEE